MDICYINIYLDIGIDLEVRNHINYPKVVYVEQLKCLTHLLSCAEIILESFSAYKLTTFRLEISLGTSYNPKSHLKYHFLIDHFVMVL